MFLTPDDAARGVGGGKRKRGKSSDKNSVLHTPSFC